MKTIVYIFLITFLISMQSMAFSIPEKVAFDSTIVEKEKKAEVKSQAKVKTINTIISEGVTVCPFAIILPRLSPALIAEIQSPVAGDLVWNIQLNCLQFFNGEQWVCFTQ